MDRQDMRESDGFPYRSLLRLRHLERVAYWRGRVCRADLTDTYDISGVQASNDFQRYLELNPEALRYDLRRKRYLWNPTAAPALYRPSFEDAVDELLEDVAVEAAPATVARLSYPVRRASLAVQRAFMAAVLNRQELTIRYGSLGTGGARERRIAPHAFGHDGFRWHARAWCFDNGEYRDFVLGRVLKVVRESPLEEELPEDGEWLEPATVTARLNPKLGQEQQAALREDFDLDRNGRLKWPTRKAMAFYAIRHLQSLSSPDPKDRSGRSLPWFVEVGI